MSHNVRVYLMLWSEHYGRLYRKTIVEREQYGRTTARSGARYTHVVRPERK